MKKFAELASAINTALDTDLYKQEAYLIGQTLDEGTIDKIAAYEKQISDDKEVQKMNLPTISILKLAEQLVYEETMANAPQYVAQVEKAASLGERFADILIDEANK